MRATAAFLMAALVSQSAVLLSAEIAAPSGRRVDRYGDPLPDGAVLRLGTMRLRPGNWCRCVTFSPDGRILGTLSELEIALWDVATGRQLRSMRVAGLAEDIDFSPDGTVVAAVLENDGTVQLFDARSGQLRLQVPGHTDRAHSVRFAPDGKTFATTADNGTLTLWDAATGTELLALHLTQYQWWQTPIAFSPDGNLLACGVNEDIRLFDLSLGEDVGAIKKAHGDQITRLAFSPDGKTLFSSGCRYQRVGPQAVTPVAELRSFNLTGRMRIRNFFGDAPVSGDCVFGLSRDSRIAVSRQANNLMVWDVASGKPTRTIPAYWLPLGVSQGHIEVTWAVSQNAFTLSPDGKTFACAATPLHNVILWDVASGQQKPAFPDAHCGSIHGIACAADGARIATCADDGSVRLWKAADSTPLKTFWLSNSFPCRLDSVVFSRDGKTLAAAGHDRKGGDDVGFVRIFDSESGTTRREIEAGSNVAKVAISHDGSKLLIERNSLVDRKIGGLARGRMISEQPAVMQVDVRSGVKRPLFTLKSPLLFLAYSTDGAMIETIERDGSFKTWKTATGELVHSFVVSDAPARPKPLRQQPGGPFRGLSSAAVSTDGTLAVVGAYGSHGGTIWDLTKEKPVGWFSPQDERFGGNGVAISPNCRLVATYSLFGGRRPVRIWDTKSGRLLKTLEQPSNVSTIQFTPDGRRLITGMTDGTALAWEVPE
jgi:WD40 repeat protein